jgi:hypothetical protein
MPTKDRIAYQIGYDSIDGELLKYLPLNVLIDMQDTYRAAALIYKKAWFGGFAKRIYDEIGTRPYSEAITC